MLTKINKIAVIGTGVIGTGWIIRMLAHNKKVMAFDLNIKQKSILIKEIKRSLPFVKRLFKKKNINLKNLSFKTSLIETLKDADFIQECATENYKLKIKLISDIGKYSKSNSIISSSSSGLLPSIIFSKCKNPNRGIIGHPFNPVYMLPAVEIVSGKKTSKSILKKANNFYKSLIKAMRHYDYTVNITWVMAHYNAANHYISGDNSSAKEIESTGGSDWKKYMHPKYQKRIFFPDLWSEKELNDWGTNL